MNFYSRGPGNICLLFDSALGGGGTNANETTQTTSGNARGVAGNNNQYIESGSIGIKKGKYIESGGIDVSGQKIQVAKGAALTINQAPAAGSSATGLNGAPQPISVPGSTPSPNPPPAIPPTPGTDTSSTPPAASTSSLLDTLKGYWANFSTWQKIGAGAVLALTLWLVFHKRSKG